MKVYVFDTQTGEYLRTEDAFQEPIGGTFVKAVNSTFVQPPNIDEEPKPDNMVWVFNTDTEEWKLEYDFRGRMMVKVADSGLSTMKNLGNVPDGYVLIPLEYVDEYFFSPDYFTISEEAGVVRKTDEEIAEINNKAEQDRVREFRNSMLDNVDWRIERAKDAATLGIECVDNIESLARYRQFLRDFTETNDWWVQKIPIFEEYIESIDGISN